MKTTQTLDDRHEVDSLDDKTPAERKASRRHNVLANVWLVLWVVTLYVVNHEGATFETLGPWLVAAMAGLGIGVGMSYLRVVQGMDELRRKIELDALAVGFGVGIIGGIVYPMAEMVDWFAYSSPQNLVVVMMVGYWVARWFGHRRYR